MAYIENQPHVIKNPDGEYFNVFVSGDEFNNYIHDEYGNKIIEGKDGYYYYAVIERDNIRTGRRINKEVKSLLIPHNNFSDEQVYRRADRMYEVSELQNDSGVEGFFRKILKSIGIDNTTSMYEGVINNIVIFIRFADDDDTGWNTETYYQSLLNGENSSVKHYYKEVSYNKAEINSHFFPSFQNGTVVSYQDIHPRDYFRPISASNPIGYTSSQRTEREHSLLERAILAVRDQIPADIELDRTNNGRVDAVSFIVKGTASGWASILWAHRWSLFSKNVTINGKRVWDFTFQPESQATLTILSHELFHVYGAPDLYRYSGGSFTPVGIWDIMANGRGHMSAHLKYKYTNGTWIESIPVITLPGRYTLKSLASNSENNAYRINCPNSTEEYFILEFRNRIIENTYDSTALPQSGLIVYRIHEGINSGNRNGPPDEVYVFRPGGTPFTNGNITFAAFNQNYDRTEITNTTNPRLHFKDNSETTIEITDIEVDYDNDEVSFNYNFETIEEPVIYNVTGEVIGGEGSIEGLGEYTHGDIVTLNAVVGQNLQVDYWELGDIISEDVNTLEFTCQADVHVILNLKEKVFTVNVITQINNSAVHMGTITGGGKYPLPATVLLEAIPNPGYKFINWNNGFSFVYGTNPTLEIVVPDEGKDKSIARFARFELDNEDEVIKFNVTGDISGDTSGTINGIGEYLKDSIVTLSYTPSNADKWEFVHWLKNGVHYSDDPEIQFDITEDTYFVLVTRIRKYSVTGHVEPSGVWKIEGSGSYEYGSDVVLIATPTGPNHWQYQIDHWELNDEFYAGAVSLITLENITSNLYPKLVLKKGGFIINKTVTPEGQGQIVGGDGEYQYGESVTLTPSINDPDKFRFKHWVVDGVVRNTSTLSLNITSPVVEVELVLEDYTQIVKTLNVVATVVSGQEHMGIVTGSGSYTIPVNTVLEAIPNPGYQFKNWQQGGNILPVNTSQYPINVPQQESEQMFIYIQASFEPVINSVYTVEIDVNPNEAEVLGAGEYQEDDPVNITILPNDGWIVDKFYVNEVETTITNNQYEFIIKEDTLITIQLKQNLMEPITILATANEGYTFVNWTTPSAAGDPTFFSDENPYQFTPTLNMDITANFVKQQFQITKNTQGYGTIEGPSQAEYGDTVTFIASPSTGSKFIGWEVNGEFSEGTTELILTITSNVEVVAVFEEIVYTVNLSVNPPGAGTVEKI